MLRTEQLSASYGPVRALREVTLNVARSEIVAVVGANGAGKTTLLRAVAGIIPVDGGQLLLEGEQVTGQRSHRLIRRGVVLVPEGRQLFPDLSVRENLLLGAFPRHRRASAAELKRDTEACFELFPILRERISQLAGTLSGGQQQMLAIARGLMSRPRLFLLDEPSLGLAPLVIKQIFHTLAELRKTSNLTILLVEQDVQSAFSIADRGYVMQNGRIVAEGNARHLMDDPKVQEIYFGKGEAHGNK